MANLKYPERLLQPFPSLTRFAQELYAMFRVQGDDTDIEPADAGRPKPAEQRQGQKLERDPSRVRPEPLPDLTPSRPRATTNSTTARPSPPTKVPEPAVAKSSVEVIEERRRAAAAPISFPGPAARQKPPEAPRPSEVRRERASSPEQPTYRPAPAEIAPPPARRDRSVADPPARRDRPAPEPAPTRERRGVEQPLPERRVRDLTPPQRRPQAEPPAYSSFPFSRQPWSSSPADELTARKRADDPLIPSLPVLGANYPHLGGGAGTTVFVGQVESHIAGEPAQVLLYPDGPESPADPVDPVPVTIPTLADGERLEPGMWLFGVFEFSDADGNPIYYAQPPVWIN